jgi:ketosteroid isomerase-like protein
MTHAMQRSIAFAAALAIGAGLNALSAQPSGQDALKAEVSAAWEDYLKLFAEGRADAIGDRVYLAPSFNLTANGPNVSMTPADTRARFETSIAALVKQNYARTTTKHANICVLNDATAILSVQWTRYRKDGSVLSEPAGTYVFSKTKDGWRIIAQTGHAPERVISCGA